MQPKKDGIEIFSAPIPEMGSVWPREGPSRYNQGVFSLAWEIVLREDMTDEAYMRRALRLARRGAGWVSPNPMVGAVVVRRGNIIGEGYHCRFGEPHAEIHALDAAGADAVGATLYVTLEPCCHVGKTPPCVDRVLASGVRQVVCGMVDPFPLVHGRGIAALRANGIEVRVGILEPACRKLNAAYVWRLETGVPLVTVKAAMTLDGKIAAATGESRWISSAESRREVQRLRYEADAALTGIGTVLADDPMLAPRTRRRKPHHLRIVLDPDAEIPLDSQLVRSAKEYPLLVFVAEGVDQARKRALTDQSVQVLEVPGAGEHLDLHAVFRCLGERPLNHVLVEAGGRLVGSLLEHGLVNRLIAYVAPKLLPDPTARPMAVINRTLALDGAIPLEIDSVRRSGVDVVVTATIKSTGKTDKAESGGEDRARDPFDPPGERGPSGR